MMLADWRLPVNQILFGLTFTPEITDDVVEWNANSAIRYESLDLGPAVYCRAIGEALASGERLDGLDQVPQFSQAQIVDFLSALAARLEAQRPWPEPRFRVLDANPWGSFRHAEKIAELDIPLLDLMPLLRGAFDPAGEGQDGKYFMILALQTGETVALLGSYARGERVSLLAQGAEDPDAVIEHFVDATGLPSNKIVRV
jgi:hypothetical protein